jgi:GT2 family glycosyltransferase/glycosyltransferase involved in cell wall biosynthesis
MSRPLVSVLLVSWNTRALTLACLDSLPASVRETVPSEVIVIDNGSTDGSAEELAARTDVHLVANDHNRGFAAAVNQAYARSSGELVLLLNSDVRLAPGALTELVRFLEAHPEAAGVAPVFVNPDGTPQQQHYRLPDLGTALALVTGLRRLPPLARRLRAHRLEGEDFNRPRRVDQPSASCLLLRRSCLPDAELLDPRLPVFFNDVALARRLAGRGHVLWVVPAARATHELGASTRLLGAARERHHLAGLVRYVASTESRRRVALLRAAILLDRGARCLLGRRTLPLRELWAALRGDPGPLPGSQPREAKGWVVYASAIGWRFHRNRQQELAEQLAADRRVLFLEPPGLVPSPRLRVERLSEDLWRAEPPTWLPLGRFLPFCNELNRRLAARALRRWLDARPGERLLLIDEDLAGPLAGRLGERAVVYDASDLDWTFTRSWNRWHLRRALARSSAAADLVLVSSPELPSHLAGRAAKVELPNACDPLHFRADGVEAPELARIPRPRLGYVGALDERAFDAPLVAELARLRPEWSLVLAGPSTASARRQLEGLPNVHLLGPVPYDRVPGLLRGCDVCLIPYRTGGRTGYCQPKKLYEYLATGKAVVSTPLPALARTGAPHRSARTAAEFVEAIAAALAEAANPELIRARRETACANTWDERGARLRDLVRDLEERAA